MQGPYNKICGCYWWPGDIRSQGICHSDIDLVIPEYYILPNRNIDLIKAEILQKFFFRKYG